MANHFSDIGFPVHNQQEMVELVLRAAQAGEHHLSLHGEYIVWAPGAGVEVWVQVRDGNAIVDVNPHFAGMGRMHMGITQVLFEQENPLQGALAGWVGAGMGALEAGAYPLTVHLPDFDLHRRELAPPMPATLQVAAFAQELAYYPSDRAFFDGQGIPFKLSAESFFPLGGPPGLPGAEREASPESELALFAGHVEQTTLLTNPITGRRFYAILTHVLDGFFDVVADEALLSLPPAPGGVLHGTFWLSGRMVREQG